MSAGMEKMGSLHTQGPLSSMRHFLTIKCGMNALEKIMGKFKIG